MACGDVDRIPSAQERGKLADSYVYDDEPSGSIKDVFSD